MENQTRPVIENQLKVELITLSEKIYYFKNFLANTKTILYRGEFYINYVIEIRR